MNIGPSKFIQFVFKVCGKDQPRKKVVIWQGFERKGNLRSRILLLLILHRKSENIITWFSNENMADRYGQILQTHFDIRKSKWWPVVK